MKGKKGENGYWFWVRYSNTRKEEKGYWFWLSDSNTHREYIAMGIGYCPYCGEELKTEINNKVE